MGPDSGSVMVTFYRKPEILELVEKIASSPVAWIYWWATEVLHISHACMQLVLKGCDMDEVLLITETDWDHSTWKVTTPFEDAADEFTRRVEEDGLIFDMAALAPPTPQSGEAAIPTAAATNGEAGENVTSKGFYMSSERQAAVAAMGLREEDSFGTRATDAASRVSGATANTSGADTFRSRTTVDNNRSHRAKCIENARRKAEEIANSLLSPQTGGTPVNPTKMQGKPASKGPATTAPGKTSEATSREAMMGSGASG